MGRDFRQIIEKVVCLSNIANHFRLLHEKYSDDSSHRTCTDVWDLNASKIHSTMWDALCTLHYTTVTSSYNRFILIIAWSYFFYFSTCVSCLSFPSISHCSQSSTANNEYKCTCTQQIGRYVEQQQRLVTDGQNATLETFTELPRRRTSTKSNSLSTPSMALINARMERLTVILYCLIYHVIISSMTK